MNKTRRNIIKYTFLQFLALFISKKSFAKKKQIERYKIKSLNGFSWYFHTKDR